jgi:hypothetical protein
MRRRDSCALGALALGLVTAVSLHASPVRANGRMPGATELTIGKGDPRHLLARATYGLVQSFDGGESWQWICEQAINVSGEADPPLALTADGSVVLLPTTGAALISRDRGCSWQEAPAPLLGHKPIDLTVDPTDPAHVLVLTGTIDAIDDRGVVSYRNALFETRDNAASWREVGTLPSDLEVETLEIAASDPKRLYVSGTASASPLLGVIERSDDGGETWTRTTLDLPPSSGSLFVSAVDPTNPDRLWVRVPAQGDRFGLFPTSLLLSSDKGASFAMIGATEKGMLGFALSPDGTRLAYGGPFDGLYVGAADGSSPFVQVAALRVRCLRWNADGLYACGSEPQDPFSLGLSTDEGASFRTVYRMIDTCPQACADGTSFAQSCEQSWSGIGPRIAASGERCSVSWARPPPTSSDAGAVGAADAGTMRDASAEAGGDSSGRGGTPSSGGSSSVARPDAGAAPSPAAMHSGDESGCSCAALGARADVGARMGSATLWALLAVLPVLTRRRARRGRHTAPRSV